VHKVHADFHPKHGRREEIHENVLRIKHIEGSEPVMHIEEHIEVIPHFYKEKKEEVERLIEDIDDEERREL